MYVLDTDFKGVMGHVEVFSSVKHIVMDITVVSVVQKLYNLLYIVYELTCSHSH